MEVSALESCDSPYLPVCFSSFGVGGAQPGRLQGDEWEELGLWNPHPHSKLGTYKREVATHRTSEDVMSSSLHTAE